MLIVSCFCYTVRFAREVSPGEAASFADLGVAEFGLLELVTCGRDMLTSSASPPSFEWLRDLYSAIFLLATGEPAAGSLAVAMGAIRSLPMFLLHAPPRLASCDDGRIFTKLSGPLELQDCPPGLCVHQSFEGPLSAVADVAGLRMLHPELLALINSCEPAMRLLEVLSIREATGEDAVGSIFNEHQAEFVGLTNMRERTTQLRSAQQLWLLQRFGLSANSPWGVTEHHSATDPPVFLVQAISADGSQVVAPASSCRLTTALGSLLSHREKPSCLDNMAVAWPMYSPISFEDELQGECFLVESLGCRPLEQQVDEQVQRQLPEQNLGAQPIVYLAACPSLCQLASLAHSRSRPCARNAMSDHDACIYLADVCALLPGDTACLAQGGSLRAN